MNNSTPTDENKIVANKDTVQVYLLIETKIDNIEKYYLGISGQNGLPTSVKLQDKIIPLNDENRLTMALWDKLELNWFYVAPAEKHEDFEYGNDPETPKYKWFTNNNPDKGGWLGKNGVFGKLKEGQFFDILEYSHIPINSLKNKIFFLNTQSHDGSRFYLAELKYGGKTYHSAGEKRVESVSNLAWDKKNSSIVSYSLGIKSNVHRISRLSDHPSLLVSCIEAYKYIPWLYGSAGASIKNHQTERFIGFDCADLAVAGWRATGHKNINYTYASGLSSSSYTNKRGKWGKLKRLGNTIYRIDSGDPINLYYDKNIKTGDILLIDHSNDGTTNHTAMLYKDNNNQFLDGGDWLIFAHHEGVVISTLSKGIPEEDSFRIFHFKDDGSSDIDNYNNTLFSEKPVPKANLMMNPIKSKIILSLPYNKNPFNGSFYGEIKNSPIYFRGAGFDLSPKTFTFDNKGALIIPETDIDNNIKIIKYDSEGEIISLFFDNHNKARSVRHITVDNDENIIIVASNLYNQVEKSLVYIYDKFGNFVYKFGRDGKFEPFDSIDYLGVDDYGNIIVDNYLFTQSGVLLDNNFAFDESNFPYFKLSPWSLDILDKYLSPVTNLNITNLLGSKSFITSKILMNNTNEVQIFVLEKDKSSELLNLVKIEY